MNSIASGVYVMLDEDNDVNYYCNIFAPSCYILRKTLPLAIQHIADANAAFEETYLENKKSAPNN